MTQPQERFDLEDFKRYIHKPLVAELWGEVVRLRDVLKNPPSVEQQQSDAEFQKRIDRLFERLCER